MRTMLSSFLVLSLAISMMASVQSSPLQSGPLRFNYYRFTCPAAEHIVKLAVARAVAVNPGIAAGLIRMHFHDCFIRGCDASVLLDSTPGKPAEKMHPANNPSLRGFEVIDEAKALIEAYCPKTVSCADILAFAARDGASLVGNINYAVPAGRRDGRVSNASEIIGNLPPPSFNAQQLIAIFAQKGMSLDEMVTLSGAHSIGVSHCSSFSPRLYSFNTTNKQDPSLNRNYAAFLKTKCPKPSPNNSVDPTVPLDPITRNKLDNKYYQALIEHHGLLESDQTLLTSRSTSWAVYNNARFPQTWANKFASAMVHMGTIEVKTGREGEIREKCRLVNKPKPAFHF